MIWLMIALLVSVGVLLLAAAGVAHHIRVQHRHLDRKPIKGAGPAFDLGEETDLEVKP
jgi:hypothetical protein